MTEEDLKQAVLKVLDQAGDLGRLKAELRLAVYKSLLHDVAPPPTSTRSVESDTIKFIYGLINEFLQWDGRQLTRRVLETECFLAQEALPTRSHILQQFNLIDSEQSKQLPLLIGIVDHFKNEVKQLE